MDEPVRLELTSDEALVLFEFLSRFSNTDKLSIEDQAEQRALWKLTGLFEKQLLAPFHPDYVALLAAARNRLRDDL